MNDLAPMTNPITNVPRCGLSLHCLSDSKLASSMRPHVQDPERRKRRRKCACSSRYNNKPPGARPYQKDERYTSQAKGLQGKSLNTSMSNSCQLEIMYEETCDAELSSEVERSREPKIAELKTCLARTSLRIAHIKPGSHREKL